MSTEEPWRLVILAPTRGSSVQAMLTSWSSHFAPIHARIAYPKDDVVIEDDAAWYLCVGATPEKFQIITNERRYEFSVGKPMESRRGTYGRGHFIWPPGVVVTIW